MDKIATFLANRKTKDVLNKLSNAIGILYKPNNIRRMAKANKTAEELEIEKEDLRRRAEYRRREEDAAHQIRMESVVLKALPDINEDANPDSLDDDWKANFFDKCRNVSDKDMQSLWARVLAGEVNAPGTYSKRTLSCISDLGKKEAELFTTLCGFGWLIGEMVPIVFDSNEGMYNKHGVNFSTLSHLDSIGLVNFNSVIDVQRQHLPKKFSISYYGRKLALEMPNDTKNTLSVGNVRLTQIGQELAPICGSKPVSGFWEYVIKKWRQYSPTEI